MRSCSACPRSWNGNRSCSPRRPGAAKRWPDFSASSIFCCGTVTCRQRRRAAAAGAAAKHTAVTCIYVSPLRALTYDIEKNLRAPIAGMGLEKRVCAFICAPATPARASARNFAGNGAHLLVTTPESLAVMLAQESYVQHLTSCRFVIVDELHSFAGNKRGADLTISLERLERLAPHTIKIPFAAIGLSATAAPLELLAHFLVGRRSALPHRGGADREEIDRRSLLTDPAESLSARRLYRARGFTRSWPN